MQHEAEQDPHLHALTTGQTTSADLGLQETLELLASGIAMQSKAILKIAKEIDELRAAVEGRQDKT